LVLVDGGKGQLQAALDALPDLTQPVELAALAKEHEHLFRPGESEPIVLPRDAAALHLLQRIRDEAHRFAVSYHRRLRDEEGRRSLLDEIPGIGPRRRKNLLKHFGSIAGIRAASLEELARVPGMTKRAALAVHAHLGSQEPDRAQS
jgi:excinuclease ABC subunit C